MSFFRALGGKAVFSREYFGAYLAFPHGYARGSLPLHIKPFNFSVLQCFATGKKKEKQPGRKYFCQFHSYSLKGQA